MSEIGTGKLARIKGMRVAGKSGTSNADGHVYASFVGTVLDREPQFVALVGLEGPREGGSGPNAAAPVFARIARRILGQPLQDPARAPAAMAVLPGGG
jgi:cell division protein FtsI/penicillin-binding protein 2